VFTWLKPVYTGAIKERCQHFTGEALRKARALAHLAMQPDHIQLFARVWLFANVADVVKESKGNVLFHLRVRWQRF
jgi:hypothetical protein